MTIPDGGTLTCEECGRKQAVGKRGSRAYLTDDEDEPAEAILYYPECAYREFSGGTTAYSRR